MNVRRIGLIVVLSASLLVSVIALPGVPSGAASAATPTAGVAIPSGEPFEGFDDAPGGRYYSTPVNWAGASGLTNGVGNGPYTRLFGPERSVVRQEFITWLWRLQGSPGTPPDQPYPPSGFGDVVPGSYYEQAVNWAKATAVTQGIKGGTEFGVGVPITRSQILLFLWRLAGEPADAPPSGLTDAPDGVGFYDAVNWGVAVGITTGVGSTGKFLPANNAKRAEAITMLYRDVTQDLGIDPAHDAAVRINEIQMMGTHNSYRVRTPAPLFNALINFRDLAKDNGVDPFELDYGNRPLAQQFTRLGARQIELDVFADPDGGLYANRAFNAFPTVGLPPASGEPALNEPGFKVLHIQDLDYATTCLTFVACLEQVEAWSDANPTHLPIMILVEVKADAIPALLGLQPAIPPAITPELLDALDAEIRSVLDPGDMITPTDVQGGSPSLRDAVTSGTGWPTLADGRGKLMFGLDNAGGIRDDYVGPARDLAGRVMFAEVGENEPGAAFFKRNTAADPSTPGLIEAGFMVRTRADGPYTSLIPPVPAVPGLAPGVASGVLTRLAAWTSGASWISSDYLEPTDSTALQVGVRGNLFTSYLPAGGVARCNPISATPACDDFYLLSDLFAR
jgi:hypothetical protein